MLLISKFNDYYDTCIGYGVDKSIVFKRKEENTVVDIYPYFKELRSIYSDKINWGDYGCVLFCGKIYPFYKLSPITDKTEYIFDTDKIKNNNVGEIDFRFSSYIYRKKTYDEKVKILIDKIINRFDLIRSEQNILDLHHHYQSPILLLENKPFSGHRTKITINPCLKDIGFASVVDPYTAFQEISMFISGVLGNKEKETVEIDDLHMRDAKGFDKMSFKKYPTKK